MSPDSGIAPDQGPGPQPWVGQKVTLHLGVVEQPYRTTGNKMSALTTGDVAEILEGTYGIMGAFYRAHQGDIARDIENGLAGALEALMMGQQIDPWGRAMQSTQRRFRDFISTQEVERVGISPYSRLKTKALIGVPTKAALRGVNHRLAHPYASTNPRRPSFRDTGLYIASFRSWVST